MTNRIGAFRDGDLAAFVGAQIRGVLKLTGRAVPAVTVAVRAGRLRWLVGRHRLAGGGRWVCRVFDRRTSTALLEVDGAVRLQLVVMSHLSLDLVFGNRIAPRAVHRPTLNDEADAPRHDDPGWPEKLAVVTGRQPNDDEN